MNLEYTKTAFLDELQKIALTRSVQEWRASQAAGNTAGANQIAQGAGQLGLKPRYLENISTGGTEAAVDKMMGQAGFNNPASAAAPNLQQRLQQFKQNKSQFARASTQHATAAPGSMAQQSAGNVLNRFSGPQGMLAGTQPTPAPVQAPNESGYIAQKVYKPDSGITTGKETSQLLGLKQKYTDTARSLSPDAKDMMPAMYGHKEIQGPQGQLRHVSQHELVSSTGGLRKDPMAFAETDRFQRKVVEPMAARGMQIGDVPRVSASGRLGGNTSNALMSPDGIKVVDFMPGGQNSPVKIQAGSSSTLTPQAGGTYDLVSPGASANRQGSSFTKQHQMNTLRQEVYNPQAVASTPKVRAVKRTDAAANRLRPTPSLGAVAPPHFDGATAIEKGTKALSGVGSAAHELGHAQTTLSKVPGVLSPAKSIATKAFKPIGQLAHAAHLG